MYHILNSAISGFKLKFNQKEDFEWSCKDFCMQIFQSQDEEMAEKHSNSYFSGTLLGNELELWT